MMKPIIQKLLCLVLVLLCLGTNTNIEAQSIATTFGKNRVQYHDDFKYWDVYETENFVTYWYGKGRYVAQSVVQLAELDHREIQNVMEHRFNDKIEIIVYVDVTDLKQSNHGVEETFVGQTGETKIVGNKMFVYFDGNHQTLRKKIREGIATVYINSILFGSNIQEIVQNAVLLDVPAWYKDGLIDYVGNSWDYEYDDELRDLLNRNPEYYQFDKLANDFPAIAGHSMWHYIDQNYGRSSISNILYLTRINRKLESSFLYVLSTELSAVTSEWSSYYQAIYDAEDGKYDVNTATELDLRNKNFQPISQISLSPDATKLAYAYNDIGKLKVVLLDLETGEDRVIYKSGFRNPFQETDYNYPLLCWHPNSKQLTYLYEDRDVAWLVKYYPSTEESEEQRIPTDFQRIYSLSYIDADNYIMSANTDGVSDLFHYKYKTRQFENLTNDFYDDLEAIVAKINGRQGVIFKSNRTDNLLIPQTLDTILPIDNFDLFFYDLEDDSKSLDRLTFTPFYNEQQAILLDGTLAFISNETGMDNRHIKKPNDDDNGYINSNKDRNIILHDGNAGKNTYIYTDYRDGAYRCYMEFVDVTEKVQAFTTHYRKITSTNGSLEVSNMLLINNNDSFKEYPEMEPGYTFQSKYEDPEVIEDISITTKDQTELTFGGNSNVNTYTDPSELDVLKFNPARIIASRKKFRLDNFTTRMDNSVLFEGLESFIGQDKELTNQPLGILLKANIVDIFEDYSLEGGVRIPTTFDGSEYFVIFENRKNRLDKTYALYRKSNTELFDDSTFPSQRVKRTALLGMYQVKYPFNIYKSLRVSSTLRFDRLYYQSSDVASLNEPFENEKRLSIKAEYIFDNTIDIDMNVKNGTRYKVYSEVINSFDLDIVDGFNLDVSNGFTTVIGYDWRHYIPLFKHGVIAFRAAGATSFGSKKMLYYLGGTENWLLSSFDSNIPTPQDDSYAYKALAPTLRGFDINVRNGGSYALVNAEVRLPIFKLLSRNKIKSSILRNFQLVGFYDVGTAWVGWSPYSDQNPINTLTLESPPIITVDIEYFRDPLVMGFGGGVRTALFGYYIRLDYAYGVETKTVTDPRLYFSIGTDF